MRDITHIDWKEDYTKIVEGDPILIPKQKVFFLQNGIEYDGSGVACNKTQVKKHYAQVAVEAQATADAAIEAAKQATANADALLKNAGVTKTAARKAAG